MARLLGGMASELSSPAYPQYATVAQAGWQDYIQNFHQPLNAWAKRELAPEAGNTVFYPFSGPDLPSVLAVFPTAARIVMISDQYALRYLDPLSLKATDQARVFAALGDAWVSFGQRGFFVTQELNNRGGDHKFQLTPTMILLAFAVRLGYEVRAVGPVCLDPDDATIRRIEARDVPWSSVRLELHKDGRDLVVDYLQQDLSNRGIAQRSAVRTLIQTLGKGPVLLKAASHLPQQPGFTVLRNAILAQAPIVVQDETGLEYDAMAQHFHVRLYGQYVSAHRLFKEFTNPSLVAAYKNRAREVKPISFKMGYLKEAGAAIQVAVRK